MFWLLMRTRLISARNVVRDTWRQRPVAAAAMGLAGICLFGGMFLGSLIFFKFATALGVLEETIYQAFYYLFLLLLAGAVPFVASTLLQAADYSLLFAAPIPPRTVIAAKLLDATITNSLQFTVLGVPAIVAGAIALSLPPLVWPIVLLLIGLFVLLPALLTAFALLLTLAVLGMPRLRAAITLINVLMGILICITFVLEAHNLPFKLSGLGSQIGQFQPALTAISPSAHAMPSAWFAGFLIDLASGSATAHHQAWGLLALILFVNLGLFAASMFLGGRLLSVSSMIDEARQGGTFGVSDRDDARRWRRVFAPPVAAMIVKDVKFFWRDTMLLSQLSVPLILILVPYLIALQNRGAMDPRTELFPFAAVIVAFILFIQTSILSLSLLGMEAQGFWMVLLAPASRTMMLWAKFLTSTLVSGGVALVLCALVALSFHADIVSTLALMAVVALCAAGLCGLGVGISAMFPRFLHENPAMRVSPWALIVSFFATTGYMLFTLLIFGFTWLASANSSAASNGGNTIIAVGFGLHVLLTVAVTVVAMGIGARHIERYEWQH